MINGFLQFLKKQKFVNNLARADLLFLLRSLQTFKAQLPLAAFAVRPSGLRAGQRIKNTLSEEDYRLPALFAPAVALAHRICPPQQNPEKKAVSGNVRIRRNLDEKERTFAQTLIAELLAKDLTQFAVEDWLHTLDINYDLRLYGSELERILSASSGLSAALATNVDWIRTSREELWLDLPDGVSLVSKLPIAAQQNLADLFFDLLFTKGIFPADWRWVAVDRDNRVIWTDFSAVFSADFVLKNYALAYLRRQAEPQDSSQQNLARALRLLKLYCPQLDLVQLTAGQADFAAEKTLESSLPLNLLQQNGFPSANAQTPDAKDPRRLVYLLDSRRHRQNPLFRKSSFYYWGPLLVAVIILYYYF